MESLQGGPEVNIFRLAIMDPMGAAHASALESFKGASWRGGLLLMG